MFGDVPFFGSYYCSSDNKGRIIMPSDSKASNDDSFVLCYSDMANTFDVFQSNILNIRIRSLDNTIFSSSSTETEVRKAKLLRSQICGSIVKPISVSSQRRLTLGTDFFRDSNFVIVHGEGDSFKLFTTEDSYEAYTHHPYVKAK